MIDALIELGVIDKIVISIIVIVLLISLNNYFGGPKNHSIRDLHQRNIILAGLPSKVLTCTLPQLANTGATIIILHPNPIELIPIINAIKLTSKTSNEIFVEKCDITKVEDVKKFSNEWNQSQLMPTGPSNMTKSYEIRRLDGVIFSTDFDISNDNDVDIKEKEASSHLLLLSLLPSIIHSPNERDIRIIKLVQPLYSAGNLFSRNYTNVMEKFGTKSLKSITIMKFLQSEIDNSKINEKVLDINKGKFKNVGNNNIKCLAACPGFLRQETIYPLLKLKFGVFGDLIYYLLTPILIILTKSNEQGAQTILFTLLSNDVIKGQLYRDNKLIKLQPIIENQIKENELKVWNDTESNLKKFE